jgi:hypothetical protein
MVNRMFHLKIVGFKSAEVYNLIKEFDLVYILNTFYEENVENDTIK